MPEEDEKLGGIHAQQKATERAQECRAVPAHRDGHQRSDPDRCRPEHDIDESPQEVGQVVVGRGESIAWASPEQERQAPEDGR